MTHDRNVSRSRKRDPRVTRCLRQAARLTPEQWTVIYWRYVKTSKILNAVRTFHAVATQAFLEELKRVPLEELGTRDPVVMRINERIEEIVAVLPESELDTKRGGYLRQRAEWVIVHVNQALTYAELLNADPDCRKAVKTFLTLFEGMIDFPEFA